MIVFDFDFRVVTSRRTYSPVMRTTLVGLQYATIGRLHVGGTGVVSACEHQARSMQLALIRKA